MDMLRTMLSVCCVIRRNPLSTLIAVLAAAPLASAQQPFPATSGSADANGDGVSFSVAGPSFSTSGVIEYIGTGLVSPIGPDSPFTPGKIGQLGFFGDTGNPNLDMFSLTVQGVPWSYPTDTATDGQASAGFALNTSNLVISGPGTYSTTFTFFESLVGAPESVVSANPMLGCEQIGCSFISLQGSGTAILDVVPFPDIPGSLEIDGVSMTIKAPEPSTASLFALALVLGTFALGIKPRGGTKLG